VRITDSSRTSRHVRKVPQGDMALAFLTPEPAAMFA
jgi:hypothetical protein